MDRRAPPDRPTSEPPGNCLPAAVEVRAPGRLHLGFLDPAATLGRRFGSLGLVIGGFETVVRLAPLDDPTASCDRVEAAGHAALAERERAAAHLAALRTRLPGPRRAPMQLTLQQVLPAHAGFGSGTQLALAVGRAYASFQGLELDTPALARLLGRGLRSGVGIAGFDQGGLLLDGGPGRDGQPAPLLARLALPADWRVLLVLDPQQTGLAGELERSALASLPPLGQAEAAALCHEVLMRVLPSAADGDFAAFAQGVSAVQALLGAHFAPAQSGRAYLSERVADLMDALAREAPRQLGLPAGLGQSSWGPTGFAILPSQAAAERLVAALRAAGRVPEGLRLQVVAPRNEGAALRLLPAGACVPPPGNPTAVAA